MREALFFIGFLAVCSASLYGWYRHSRGRPASEWYHRSPWRPRMNSAADRARQSSKHDAERPPEP